jgi:Restriction endonuclease/MacB-like periplasmic core domain
MDRTPLIRPLAAVHVLRHAARRLRHAPLFAVMSVLTLAIGIGASALMLSVVSTILLQPLPYGDPDRIEMLWGSYPDANLGVPEQPTHGAVFSIIRDHTKAFESIAAFRGASLNLGDSTAPERLDGVLATGEFFQALGVTAGKGRFFERANESPGEDHVVVLSDALWRRRFGADMGIIGRVLTLNGELYPQDEDGISMIRAIHAHFREDPYGFEECAVEIARLMDPKIISADLTRARVDGGRDAIGQYQIGGPLGGVKVEFALEAKCYALDNSVGVHEVARLISRLRHRQFGIFVTTSFVHSQAYREIRADQHPVVILAARDIVELLRSKGFGTAASVITWLAERFPANRTVNRPA